MERDSIKRAKEREREVSLRSLSAILVLRFSPSQTPYQNSKTKKLYRLRIQAFERTGGKLPPRICVSQVKYGFEASCVFLSLIFLSLILALNFHPSLFFFVVSGQLHGFHAPNIFHLRLASYLAKLSCFYLVSI